MQPPPKPRLGLFAEKPGSYSLSIRVSTPVINKGDKVQFQVFFTGYGNFVTGKVFCCPSDRVFNPKSSVLYSDLIADEKAQKISWGAQKSNFQADGGIIHLTGGLGFKHLPAWNPGTMFFDILPTEGIATVMTEILTYDDETLKHGKAPMSFELATLKSVKAGKYTLDIVFTYFNGDKWSTQNKLVEFKVQNLLERYALQIGTLALIGSSLGVMIAMQKFFQITRH